MPALHHARLPTKLTACSRLGIPSSGGSPQPSRAICSRQLGPSRRSVLLTSVLGYHFFRPISIKASEIMADSDQPANFRYVQLWVSEDGETHIKECKMSGFKKQAYSSVTQFVKDEFGGQPTNVTFTELAVGLEQPLHTCPQVQFVATLSGSWYIKTTDGAKYVFKPGEVLFQDNSKDTPAKKIGQHLSGTVGDVPCQQLIVQINRTPEVDNPNAF